jgi:RHS repeat-associated protein
LGAFTLRQSSRRLTQPEPKALCTTFFIHADLLGTERVRTNVSGGVYETCTSLPFGDSLARSNSDASPMHFTGKQHDFESGLDNFGARYYSPLMGRFVTTDWSASPAPTACASKFLEHLEYQVEQ